jgi:TP901 family phage tail tape measure protein
MAATKIDIIAQFKSNGYNDVADDYKKIIDKATKMGGITATNAVRAAEEFKRYREEFDRQLSTGEIDIKKLGLNKVISSLEGLVGSISKTMGSGLLAGLQPFQDAINKTQQEIDAEEDKRTLRAKDIAKLQDSSNIIAKAKKETGFTGLARGGQSLQQAESSLKDLEKIEDPDQKTQKKIEFFKELVKQYKQAQAQVVKLEKAESDSITRISEKQAIKSTQQAEFEKKKTQILKTANKEEKEALVLLEKMMDKQTKATKIKSDLTNEENKANKVKKESIKNDKEEGKGLTQKAAAAFSYFVVFRQLRNLFNQTLQTVKQLDKAMTDTAIVTSMNRKEAWQLLGTYQNLAKSTGLATSEISNVVVQFLRQGRNLKDAMELAEVAAKSAKVAGISANDAVNFLTSAVNGFNLAADQSEIIADKFAAVAARSATSFSELASAMSKVAPTAKSAGIGVDFMMGVIAKGIETTREAPENIGTAFKTIFARMREVTDLGKAMEDGMDLNRVEKALLSVGVPLRDVSGQFRNLETVLMDVGEKWDTLTSVEQAYLATALAGSRQQPRLLAIFNDFARTKELIQIAADSTGDLANQHVEYMMGSEAALTRLKTAWEQFTMTFIDSEIIIGFINLFSSSIEGLANLFSGLAEPSTLLIIILTAIGGVLVAMAAKLALSIFFMTAKILTTLGLAKAQGKLANNIKLTNKEMQKLDNTTKTSMITDGFKMMSSQEIGTELLIMGVNALKAGLAFALLAIKIILVVVAIVAVIAVIGILTGVIDLNQIAIDGFSKKVAENTKKLSELAAKERDIKKLADRFNELQKITNKTSEEFDEMIKLGEELKNIEFEGETFDLTRTDITGKITLNENEYKRLLDLMETRREELLQSNINQFQSAVATDLEKTLNDKNLMKVAEKIGYDFGIDFVKSFGDALSDDLETVLNNAAKRAAEIFNIEDFTGGTAFGIKYDPFGFFDVLDQDGAKALFDTREDAEAFLESQGLGAFNYLIREVDNVIDLDEFDAFIKKQLGLVKTTFEGLQTTIEGIVGSTEEGAERTAQIFTASADAFEDAETAIMIDETLTDEQRTQSIQFLGESMRDEAILNDLINKRGIDVDVIVNMSFSLNLEQINKAINDVVDKMIAKLKGKAGGRDISYLVSQFTASLTTAYGNLFSNNANMVDLGFDQLRASLESYRVFTEEEIKQIIISTSNKIKTLGVKEVAGMLKDQMDSVKKIFDLPSDLLKGDLDKYLELIEKFGKAAADAALRGDEEGMTALFTAQNQKAVNDIEVSIQKIISTARVLGRETTQTEKNQIAALEVAQEYYEEIALQQQLRNFRLAEGKALLEDMNNLLSMQQKLMDLGFEGNPIFDIFSQMLDNYESEGLGFFIKQVDTDMAAVREIMNDIDNPDTIGRSKAAVEQAMQSLGALIDGVTAAYARQKKQIEDRYKSEIDAIKDGHSERFATLDYTNKLAEAEQKIIEARRTLAGLAISGVSKGTLEQSQKDLKKLQQERQRIIEDKMVEKAEKELEKKMNDELVEVQKELGQILERHLSEMAELRKAFLDMFKVNPTPVTVADPVVEIEQKMIEVLDLQTASTNGNTRATQLNTIELRKLRIAMTGKGPTTTTVNQKPPDRGALEELTFGEPNA